MLRLLLLQRSGRGESARHALLRADNGQTELLLLLRELGRGQRRSDAEVSARAPVVDVEVHRLQRRLRREAAIREHAELRRALLFELLRRQLARDAAQATHFRLRRWLL